MNPKIEAFLDSCSETYSYVVYDQMGGHCAIIDPVLDFDYKSGRTDTRSAEQIVEFCQTNELQVDWILETHAHADHLSAAPFLRQKTGAKVAIGERITDVQTIFSQLFNFEAEFVPNGQQFDHLFKEGESFAIGTLTGKIIATPGHTPADISYQIGDALFVGDTLFMPDLGTARCDFPGGNAKTLYQSIQRLLSFPPATKVYICHDYPGQKRSYRCHTTVADQRQNNIHVKEGTTEQEFVAMREARDATLDMPRLIIPSVQVNVRAGQLPPAESNGTHYLKVPLNILE